MPADDADPRAARQGAQSYGACPIRRRHRTKVEMPAIRDAIVEVIEDDPPITVRQVFYQMVARGVIEKSGSGLPKDGDLPDDRHAAFRRSAV